MAERQLLPFGPFTKGVVDGLNVALDSNGLLRSARNAALNGMGRLFARPGTQLAFTLKVTGGASNVTSVVCVVPFADGALAVGHSDVTDEFYLYRFDADMTGWYNAAGAFQANSNAQPVGVLWTVAPDPAQVFIAEGLGTAFIAHANAGAAFRSKVYTVAGGLANLDANLAGGGVVQTFFRGVVSFQQHLWGWGYGSETAGENDRPEVARFGFPIFGQSGGGWFAAVDSFTMGHRPRSFRDRILVGVAAGEILYFGTPESIWPVTGFGKNSWDRSRPRGSGFAGPRAAVAAGDWLYYWSRQGPRRLRGLNQEESLLELIPVATASVVDPTKIVAVFDSDRGQVIWLYRNATSGRISTLAAFDTQRGVLLGPDGDIGLGIFVGAEVKPTGAAGPAAPPVPVNTTAIGFNVATGNVTPGDQSAGTTTIWEIRKIGVAQWTIANELPATQASYQFTGLLKNTQYEWRAKHRKNGQESPYGGPDANTLFTTLNFLGAPTNCTVGLQQYGTAEEFSQYWVIQWTNSGEAGVSTEVYFGGPFGSPPASGSLGFHSTEGPGAASVWLSAGDERNPAGPPGVYYAEVRHVKDGEAPSAFSNMASGSI